MNPTAAGFRDAVLAGDVDALEALLAEDVVFRSPAVHRPYEGRVATMVILRAVVRVFEDFRYTRSFTEDDVPGGGEGHLLQFEAEVAGRSVEGVDVLRIGADGLVTDLRVLIRPLSGLQAVVAGMAEVIPLVMAEQGLA